MTVAPRRVVLLGSQRRDPDAGRVLAELGVQGPAALVTAGRQEWEEDDADLRNVLAPGSFNLRLHRRAEEVWQADPELAEAHRELQTKVRKLRQAYNLRLEHASDAWLALRRLSGDPEVLEAELHDAMEAVRALDRHHAGRIGALRDAFCRRWDPLMRPSVGHARDEIRRAVEGVEAVVIAGGHVPVLLNRLRLFGVDQLLSEKTVVACSGGAMALSRSVVLFHDSPPWGPGHSELAEVGLALFPNLVPLPNGSTRLRVDDRGRVGRFALRYAPAVCLLLDPGTRADWDGHRWAPRGARRLTLGGAVEAWEGAA